MSNYVQTYAFFADHANDASCEKLLEHVGLIVVPLLLHIYLLSN
jgi:hypothetical protein